MRHGRIRLSFWTEKKEKKQLYLKSLTIRGFKSFADKTVLKFEPGITVVVGPNGSGKSNITDAVLWVLGEQSARSLRGSAMEDVIFAGSPTRSCAGLAEVSLFLDNSDGLLPIEFSEVSITRRISRIGESEYLINNSPCRLLDVQELLMDSGLGKEMYSIVSQGRLEQILTSKPEERRLLIEEAAGVLKHKKRKERALRKLTLMESNLLRAKDVLKEVNRQIQPLERQAKKAQSYHKLSVQLRDLEISSCVKQLQCLQNQWSELESNEADWVKALQDLKSTITSREEEREHLRIEIEQEQTNQMRLEEFKRRLQMCADRLRNSSFLLIEKEKAMTLREHELRQKIQQLRERVCKRQKEGEQLGEKKALALKRKGDIVTRLEELQGRLEKAATGEKELAKELQRQGTQVGRMAEIRAKKEEKLQSVQSKISNYLLKMEFLQEQKQSYALKIKEYEKALAGTNEKCLEQHVKHEQLGKEEQLHREKVEQQNRVVAELKSKREEIRKKLVVLQAEQEALKNLKAMLSKSSGLDAVQKVKTSGILGVLGELIKVPKEFEKAIEGVLGADVMCLLLETFHDAEEVLSLIKKEKLERVSMLAASGTGKKRKQVSHTAGFTPASHVVQCDDNIREAIESLLEGVFIVPDASSAFRYMKQKGNMGSNVYTLVTKEGEVIQSNGKIYASFQEKSSALLRHEIRQELESKIQRCSEELRLLEKDISCTQEQNDSLSHELASLTRQLKDCEFGLQGLISDKKRIENEISNTKSQENRLARDVEDLEYRIAAENDAAAQVQEEAVEAKRDWVAAKDHLSDLKGVQSQHAEQKSRMEQELLKCKLELGSIEEQESYLEKQTGLISEDQAELEVLLGSEQSLKQSFDEFTSRVKPLQSVFGQLLNMSEEIRIDVDSMISSKVGSMRALKDKLALDRAESSGSGEQVGKLQEKLNNVRVHKGQLEVQVTSVSQKIVDEFELSLDRAISEYETELSKDELRLEVSEIMRHIEMLGPVNPVAVEEFSELKQRREFLASQIDDLTESRRALEKVASAIDKKIKDRFVRTFQEVNFNFKSVFSYLFEGGEADLTLDEPQNPLNSGISFDVHPEGKRLQRITLLSGGEAALVALAFLFAIHHTRPSPFYILDEVEPALDSMNLQRFTSFLKAQSKETQFLVITHQKRTMEIADLLYGVSMSPEAVSSVISQKLSEFQESEQGRVYAS